MEPPVVHWHSSEDMPEVADGSCKLLIGASVYLGATAPWLEYRQLYERVYLDEGLRILRPDGYFLLVQTDQYRHGEVVTRNPLLVTHLTRHGYSPLDTKIWKRKVADMFQPPFSQVWLFGPAEGTAKRPHPSKKDYFQGIWDYPQTAGGAHNAYPDGLCRLIVESLTEPGDLVVDPFAGTARLLGVAGALGRRAVGYEIDETLRPVVEENLKPKPTQG